MKPAAPDRRPRPRGFCFAELMIAATMIFILWIMALYTGEPHLEAARRARVSLHREAALSASLLSFHARHGQVPTDPAEIGERLAGARPGGRLSFHIRTRETRVIPDGKGGVILEEVPR